MGAMTSSFKTLANAIAGPTDDQAMAIKNLGIGTEIYAMTTEDAFSLVVSKLQEMDEGARRTAIAQDLLGRGAMELGALFNTTAEDTQAMKDRVHELGGVLSDEDVKAAAAFQDSLQDMQTASQGLVRSLTTQFLPSFTGVMDGLTNVMSGNVDEGIDQMVEAFGQIGDKLVTAIPNFIQGITKLIRQILPALEQNLPMIIEMLGNAVIEIFEALVGMIPVLLPPLIKVLIALAGAIIENLPEIIQGILVAIGEILQELGIIDFFQGVWESIKAVFAAVGEWFSEVFSGAWEAIKSAWDAVVSFFQGIWDGIVAVFEAVAEWFSNLFKSASDGVQSAWDGVVSFFTGIWDGITNAFSAVGTWFSDKFHEAVDKVKGAWDGIKEFFSGIWEKIKSGFKISDALNWGKDLIKNFLDGIKQKWEDLKQGVRNVANTVKSFLGFSEPKEGPLSNFHTYAPDMMKLFAQGITQNEWRVTDAIKDAFDFKPQMALAGTADYTVRYNSRDEAERREMLATLRELRNLRVVMDTGETVGVLSGPINGALGNEYIYRKRGIV